MGYLGNGQYQITNKKTGETKTISRNELEQYGLTPHPSDVSPESPQQGGDFLSSPLGRLATGGAPIAEAVKFSPTVQRLGEEAGGAIQRATTGDLSTPSQEPGFAQTKALQAFGPLGSIIAGVTGTSQQEQKNLPAYGELGAQFVGSEVLPKVVSGIQKYGTAKRTFKTMEEAAKAGSDINWEKDIVAEARKAAESKPTSVKQALERLLTQEAPTRPPGIMTATGEQFGPVTGQPLTSPQALELRGELGSRLSKNVFGQLKIPVSSAEQNATDILRRTVSETLKKAAPDIKNPDAIYAFYKRAHGDAPTWARRIIATEFASHLLPKQYRGPLTDAIGALLQMGAGL